MHLFLHQVHHRGQATTLLSQEGVDFGATDLPEIVPDQEQARTWHAAIGRTLHARALMKQRITGFHKDDERHWVAELACGHDQHVRHNPPWINRPWVVTAEGRAKAIGRELKCKKCDTGAPRDRQA